MDYLLYLTFIGKVIDYVFQLQTKLLFKKRCWVLYMTRSKILLKFILVSYREQLVGKYAVLGPGIT